MVRVPPGGVRRWSILLGAGALALAGVTAIRLTADREQTAPIAERLAPAAPLTSSFPSGRRAMPHVLPEQVDEGEARTLEEQRAQLLSTMEHHLGLSAEQLAHVREIVLSSPVLGQGNPALSVHPMSRAACRQILRERPPATGDPACAAINMVQIPVDAAARGDDVPTCIDQFEFPNLPCEYPVVLVKADEAARLCEAVDKRICDAHEWEGACAGRLLAPEQEYSWTLDRAASRYLHNERRERVWAYGPTKNHPLCATSSTKTPGCNGGFRRCGSNTYPSGAFPGCKSSLGVYDLHGNVAEHMNLPLAAGELASRGGYGWTEMKGSWFIFASYEAHEDDCRWRAPDWHGSRINDSSSHANYHLGFRCCKSLVPAELEEERGAEQSRSRQQ